MSVGVVVGRFQVSNLHAGHKHLLEAASKHEKLLVFLACHPMESAENPLDYASRELMIRDALRSNVMICPIVDVPSDDVWSQTLDTMIRAHCPHDKVFLYCGRDGFDEAYSGRFKVHTVNQIEVNSGTAERETDKQSALNCSNFRKGIIYARGNQFPRINPTVDIAVIDSARKVLLGRKEGESWWRFPGGFVDMSDENYERAAKRELYEETQLTVEGELEYIGSERTDDWRNTDSQKVYTILFACEYSHGKPVAGDDLADVSWVGFDEAKSVRLPGHARMLELLLIKKGYV